MNFALKAALWASVALAISYLLWSPAMLTSDRTSWIPVREGKAAAAETSGQNSNLNQKVNPSQDHQSSRFWDVTLTDVAVAVFTLCLVVVGFRQEKISRQQMKLMRYALNVSTDAAKTASEAQEFTKQNAHHLEESAFRHDRAYVFPKELTVQKNEHAITCEVTLHNYGVTPTSISRMEIYWSKLMYAAPEPGRDPEAERFSGNISMLGAGQSEPAAKISKTLSETEYQNIKTAKISLYLIIWIEYEDVFRRAHITGITKRYDPNYDSMLQVSGAEFDVRS